MKVRQWVIGAILLATFFDLVDGRASIILKVGQILFLAWSWSLRILFILGPFALPLMIVIILGFRYMVQRFGEKVTYDNADEFARHNRQR